MNISSISFNGKIHNYTYKRNQNKNEKQPHSGKIIPKTLATVLASSALAILLSNTPGQALNRPQKVTIPFDNNKTSVSEISKKYNVNEDAINAFNEINENNNISELSELKVPSDFDYIQTKIEEKQTQLYSQDLNEEERFKLEEEIEALFNKQDEQTQVATVYSDGEYVYFNINIKEDIPDNLKDKYKFGINIETLKKLFDIEDGGIEDNNELNVREDAYGKYGNEKYKDYTQNWFHNGDLIRVPISYIKTDDINLSGYYQD